MEDGHSTLRSSRGYSAAVEGVSARLVEVEVTIRQGSPGMVIVGLPDASVRESRDRVRTAIQSSGFPFPASLRILVNLAPAHRRKVGPLYDLPIALGILAANGALPAPALRGPVALGELALDGRIRPVRGALPVARRVARSRGRALLVPEANAREASLCPQARVVPVDHLSRAVAWLAGRLEIPEVRSDASRLLRPEPHPDAPDLADVRGQAGPRRALEVAAAGAHNLLMVGPPGAGKTMLARRLPSILPPLSVAEALEATTIHSVAGELGDRSIVSARPFRAPHHSVSPAGLLGGGPGARPGEVSLAHRGVLFLDELPEFDRRALESLRQPLEEGRVRISRVGYSVRFPARFTLVAALNPCPCGQHGVEGADCLCPPTRVAAYRSRISGPLLDRIDLKLDVPRVRWEDLASPEPGEPSAAVRARVVEARRIQFERFGRRPGQTNSAMSTREVRRFCPLDAPSRALLRSAVEGLGLSARAHDRILRVARTIADLAAAADIAEPHLAEAIQYRLAGAP